MRRSLPPSLLILCALAANAEDYPHGRMSSVVTPLRYELTFIIEPRQGAFGGNVRIGEDHTRVACIQFLRSDDFEIVQEDQLSGGLCGPDRLGIGSCRNRVQHGFAGIHTIDPLLAVHGVRNRAGVERARLMADAQFRRLLLCGRDLRVLQGHDPPIWVFGDHRRMLLHGMVRPRGVQFV